MSYLGNLNPYMTPATYAEELRKRKQMMQGQQPMPPQNMTPNQTGPASQMSPVKQQALGNAPTNPYGLSPEEMAAMSNDTSAEEAKIKSQMDYANSLRETKSAGPRQLGNVVVNNPWEGLEVGFNRALGGYLSGKADKRLDALDEQNDAKAAALAEVDLAKYGDERSDQKSADSDRDTRTGLLVAANGREAELQGPALQQATAEAGAATLGLETLQNGAPGEGIVYTRKSEDGTVEYKTVVPVVQGSTTRYVDADTGVETSLTGWQEAGDAGGRTGATMKPLRFESLSGAPEFFAFDKGQQGWIYTDGPDRGKIVPTEVFRQYQQIDGLNAYQMENILKEYNNNIDPLYALDDDMARANMAFAELELEEGETPFNYLTKMQGQIGALSRAGDPKLQNVFAAVQTVRNTITRQRAGLSQTLNEMENIKREMGDDSIFNDPEVFVRYWDRLADKVQLDIKRIESRLEPSVMKRLVARRGERQPSARNPGPDNAGGDDSNRSTETWFGGMTLTPKLETKVTPSEDDPLGLDKDLSQYTNEELDRAGI